MVIQAAWDAWVQETQSQQQHLLEEDVFDIVDEDVEVVQVCFVMPNKF